MRGLYLVKVMPRKLFLIILSTFGEHFRLTSQTFEELVCKLANCLEIPVGHSHGGRPPISINKELLIFLWFSGKQECVRSILDRFSDTKSSVLLSCQRVCDATSGTSHKVAKWQ